MAVAVLLLLILVAAEHIGARWRRSGSRPSGSGGIAAFLLAAPPPANPLPTERPLWPWSNGRTLRRWRSTAAVAEALERLCVQAVDLEWHRVIVRRCGQERRALVAGGAVQLTITEIAGRTGSEIRCRAIPLASAPERPLFSFRVMGAANISS